MALFLDPSQPDWARYQALVYRKFADKYPECTAELDVRVPSLHGKRKRQIDIAIRGPFLGHTLFVAVECKLYTRPVDVKTVESFIGLLEDVAADIGILVTTTGFTESARERAAVSGVKLDIVEFDQLDRYEIELDLCEECDPGEEHHPGVVEWGMVNSVEGDVDRVADVGRCDWCNSLHVRCKQCGAVTGIPEALCGRPVECLGGCGTVFTVTVDLDPRQAFTETLTVREDQRGDAE